MQDLWNDSRRRRLEQDLDFSNCERPSLILPDDLPPTLHGRHAIIAHRGASYHLPEHTIESYRMALQLGADYIEPDLVPTSDGHLVAIHSLDLSGTTNVDDVFPASRQTMSKYQNANGFWAYDFTLEELKTLRVKQRVQNPVRSQTFDGQLQIPTLTEILELIRDWNTQSNPLLHTTTFIDPENPDSPSQQQQKQEELLQVAGWAGLYAELKAVPWLMEDLPDAHPGYLVDLLEQHMEDHADLWYDAILSRVCQTKAVREHHFRLPPLVIQSFDVDALQAFHEFWVDQFSDPLELPEDDEMDGNVTTAEPTAAPGNRRSTSIVVPPSILLLSASACQDPQELEQIWFNIGETYRDYISGIGIDKSCLVPLAAGRSLVERAEEWEPVVHPYTARPEANFRLPSAGTVTNNLNTNLELDTEVDELVYLFCEVGVHGVFTESVSQAVLASRLPCPTPTAAKERCPEPESLNGTPASSNEAGSSNSSPSWGSLLPAIGTSFLVGMLLSLVLQKMVFGRASHGTARTRHTHVPTIGDEDDEVPRSNGKAPETFLDERDDELL